MSVGSSRWLHYPGLIVALIGFGITRFFVAETLTVGAPIPFFIGGLVPLIVGLCLAIYGVILAIGAFSADYVRTIAIWCVSGTIAMILVLAITSVDPILQDQGVFLLSSSELLVANVLLAGAVGGTAIGYRSAVNRRHQAEIQRQVNRSLTLSRLLRHHVINAVSIINGQVDLIRTSEKTQETSLSTIQDALHRITTTIEDVSELTDQQSFPDRVNLAIIVQSEVEAIESRFPDTQINVADDSAWIEIVESHIRIIVRELLKNAAEASKTGKITIEFDADEYGVQLRVVDDGPGIPEDQQALLELGEFPEFDDPSTGFGLQIVNLLVNQYHGQIDVENPATGGTEINIMFPRRGENEQLSSLINVTFPKLYRVTLAGIIAGLVMGGIYVVPTNVLPVIGSLYGAESALIGWITHLFHSVVFALLFVAGYTHPRINQYMNGPVQSGILGILWGVVLWLIAAGIIMPVWLQLLGFQAPIPNVPLIGLATHAVWGIVLGVSYSLFERLKFRGVGISI